MLNFLKNKSKDKRRGCFIVKPYVQIVSDLRYANDDILFKDNKIVIYGRFHNKTLYKIIFVENLDDFLNLDYSNNFLRDNNTQSKFEFNFELDSFSSERVITVIIFNDNDDRVVEFSKKYCSIGKKTLTHSFVYNEKEHTLDYYHYLPDYSTLNQELLNLLTFDLAAKEKEVL